MSATVAHHGQITMMSTPTDLRAHFAEHHQPIDATVLAAATDEDLAAWHRGEHAQRHPGKRELPHGGHLRHTHPAYVPADNSAKAAA